jgi:hypothetical protein
MSKNKPVIVVPENKKRGIAKAKRNKGMNYIKSLGVDEKSYTQSQDPLFKVKGIERYNLLKRG